MLYVPNFKNEYPTCPFLYIDFNAPNSAFIEFIEKKINAKLPDHLKDPELFDFVYAHSRTCYKYKVKSFQEVLAELEISKVNYYRDLLI